MTPRRCFAPAALIACLGVACAPQPSPVPPLQAAMHQNFGAALYLRTASVRGDLELIRQAGDSLLTVLSARHLEPEHRAPFAEIRKAASGVTGATTLAEGVAGAAEVAARCGACHLEVGSHVGDLFMVGGVRPPEDLRGHMNRLAWANRLLWDGLVGPSDRTWVAGAEALAAAPAFPAELEGFELPGPAQSVQRDFDEAIEQVRAATEPTERTEALAQLWGVCGECHWINEVGR